MPKKDQGHNEIVMDVRVHTKITKGGRQLSFASLAAVGDGQGSVGIGYGKARGVPAAIEKATTRAQESMEEISMVGDTVAHEAIGEHGSSEVIIRPASRGTGVKAGATVGAIMSAAGVHNVLTKIYGPTNPLNVAKATYKALTNMRSAKEVEQLRGVKVQMDHPQLEQQGS